MRTCQYPHNNHCPLIICLVTIPCPSLPVSSLCRPGKKHENRVCEYFTHCGSHTIIEWRSWWRLQLHSGTKIDPSQCLCPTKSIHSQQFSGRGRTRHACFSGRRCRETESTVCCFTITLAKIRVVDESGEISPSISVPLIFLSLVGETD